MVEYISREAVMQKFADHVKRSNNSDFAPTPTWNEAVQIVEDIPAADVRPVVRGKWIGNKRHQSCSECHMTYCVPDGQDGELDMTAYHFCPNCGADMREEN